MRLAAWLPPFLLAMLLAGCGYSFGSGLQQRGIRTVHVQAAGNDTFRQRLEAELGAAVSRELAASSDLSPAAAGDADAVLTLRFVEEGERTLVSGDREAPVREGTLESTVHVRLVEQRSGRVVTDRMIHDRAEFRDPIGEDLATARAEMIDDLARKIVLALETGF